MRRSSRPSSSRPVGSSKQYKKSTDPEVIAWVCGFSSSNLCLFFFFFFSYFFFKTIIYGALY
jgi:hypothetical protein